MPTEPIRPDPLPDGTMAFTDAPLDEHGPTFAGPATEPGLELGGISSLPADLVGHPRYRIVRLLGEGGMGAVYAAEHRIMNRPVALKVIHPRFTSKPAAVERFRREVQAAARLQHANIVAAFDAEQAGSTHFLVMEFVDGVTLAEELRRVGKLPIRQACSVIRQACFGLQYAHEKGTVHRDIKPDNLMLAADGTVKILDFGLARFGQATDVAFGDDAPVTGQLTATGSVMGTPDYLAPEQAIDSHSADIRADLYSLGCTLYQLLAGQLPFTGNTVAAKLKAHATKSPPPLKDVPPALAGVVARLMAKDPARRYRTPAEAAAALTPFCAPPRRRSAMLTAVLAVLGVCLVGMTCLTVGLANLLWPTPATLTHSAKIHLPGTPIHLPKPEELAARQSPLDALKAETVPADARALAGRGNPAQVPTGLVAILGGPRWRLSGDGNFASMSTDGKRVATPSGFNARLFDGDGVLLREFGGHTEVVTTAAISPDGTRVLTTSLDGSARLWDADTGRLIRTEGFSGRGWGATFSADGSVCAAGAADGILRIWRSADGSTVHAVRLGAQIFGVAFSPDGLRLAAACASGVVFVVSTETGAVTHRLTNATAGDGQTLVRFAPDGRLAAGSDARVAVWDLARPAAPLWSKLTPGAGLLAFTPDGKSLWTTRHAGRDPVGFRCWDAADGSPRGTIANPAVGTFHCWTLSPDGSMIFGCAAGSFECHVRWFDTTTGKPTRVQAGNNGLIMWTAFSPDGSRLVSAGLDNVAVLWDVSAGRPLARLTGHTQWARSAAFAPDGKTVATGGWDSTARLWEADTGRQLASLPHPNAVEVVAFSPDGRRLATTCLDGQVRIWDVATRGLLRQLHSGSGHARGVVWSPDGYLLATINADATARVFEAESGQMRHSRTSDKPLNVLASVPDGSGFVTGDEFGRCRRWSWDQKSPTEIFALPGQVGGVAVSPDARAVVACGADGTLHTAELATPERRSIRRLVVEGGQWLHTPAFAPDGRHVATANPDGTVSVIRLAERGKLFAPPARPEFIAVERFLQGHTHAWVNAVVLSADGGTAWTAGTDKTVRRWRLDNGLQTGVDTLPDAVACVAASPDGKRLASGCNNGTLYVRDDGAWAEWHGHTGSVSAVAWSPDGKRLASGGADGTVRVWANGRETRSVQLAGRVWSVAWLPDSTRLLASGREAVQLWDADSGETLRSWPASNGLDHGTAVCVSTDGKRIAYGAGHGTVRVADVATGEERARFDVGGTWLRGLAFTPNGGTIVAGSFWDRTLTVWDTKTGREIDRVRFAGGLTAVAVTPDGERAVVSCSDGLARMLRLPVP